MILIFILAAGLSKANLSILKTLCLWHSWCSESFRRPLLHLHRIQQRGDLRRRDQEPGTDILVGLLPSSRNIVLDAVIRPS